MSEQTPPQPQPSRPQPSRPHGQLASLLRGRIDYDLFAADPLLSRSSSAPPAAHDQPPQSNTAVPNNDRDQRPPLPVYGQQSHTIAATGQPWQVWGGPVGFGPAVIDTDVGRQDWPESLSSAHTTPQHSAGITSTSPGAPGSNRKKLVDMIQEDFPRTPSPVFALQQLRATQSAENTVVPADPADLADERQHASKTPPPPFIGLAMPLPRSSSTPPMVRNPRPISGVYQNSPLNPDVAAPNHAAIAGADDETVLMAVKQMALDDDYDVRSQRAASPAPGLTANATSSVLSNYAATQSAPAFSMSYTSMSADTVYFERQRQQGAYGVNWDNTAMMASGMYQQQPYAKMRPGSAAQVPPPYGFENMRILGGAPGFARPVVDRSATQSPRSVSGVSTTRHYTGDKSSRSGSYSGSSGPYFNGAPLRNMTHSPVKGNLPADMGGSSRSALLEEFRASKTKTYELRDILGHIAEFSGDQHGSRFIQQKLETATGEDKQLVYEEILPNVLQLITDVFGNYVIQKFFEYGNQMQKTMLAKQMENHILSLSLQMYGCRVVQKAIEHVLVDQQAKLIRELDGHVIKLVKDQNGNHVIQKAIERIPPEHITFITDAFKGQILGLATHPYGCRVIQRTFEHFDREITKELMHELHSSATILIQDQYGNYVVQHILERGDAEDKAAVIKKVKGQTLVLSKHKFASNVIEKCIAHGSRSQRQEFIEECLIPLSDGSTALTQMARDQYANYVVQKMLDVVDNAQKQILIDSLAPHISSLKKYTYAKHIVAKVEKYVSSRPDGSFRR